MVGLWDVAWIYKGKVHKGYVKPKGVRTNYGGSGRRDKTLLRSRQCVKIALKRDGVRGCRDHIFKLQHPDYLATLHGPTTTTRMLFLAKVSDSWATYVNERVHVHSRKNPLATYWWVKSSGVPFWNPMGWFKQICWWSRNIPTGIWIVKLGFECQDSHAVFTQILLKFNLKGRLNGEMEDFSLLFSITFYVTTRRKRILHASPSFCRDEIPVRRRRLHTWDSLPLHWQGAADLPPVQTRSSSGDSAQVWSIAPHPCVCQTDPGSGVESHKTTLGPKWIRC